MDPVAGAEFIAGDFTEEAVFQVLLDAASFELTSGQIGRPDGVEEIDCRSDLCIDQPGEYREYQQEGQI
jgi:hypothetical protein